MIRILPIDFSLKSESPTPAQSLKYGATDSLEVFSAYAKYIRFDDFEANQTILAYNLRLNSVSYVLKPRANICLLNSHAS